MIAIVGCHHVEGGALLTGEMATGADPRRLREEAEMRALETGRQGSEGIGWIRLRCSSSPTSSSTTSTSTSRRSR